MDQLSVNSGIASRPVVYAGRFVDRMSVGDTPAVLGDWDVLPSQLAAAVDRATSLVVLDPFSFPFEAMTKDQRDVPLVLVLPSEFDATFLTSVFGKPVFEGLDFFDRVATGDTALWEELRGRYRWVDSQRIEIQGTSPEEAAAEVCARLEAEAAGPTFFGGEEYEAGRYWRACGEALAFSAPYRTVFGADKDPAFGKAVHRVQAAALDPQFAAARGDREADIPFEVLEVGAGVGRWAAGFDPTTTRFVGVDISEGMVEAARANFPEGRFDLLDESLLFPYAEESFDLVFSVGVMHHNPTQAKRALLSEMWRVTRPGGRLLFLEDFVAERSSARTIIYPMSVLKFVDVILEQTAGQVVLEYVEALRYPQDPYFRGGVLALTKLGVPKTW
ncbi:MAG TPA: methyltransferase domain-containing protein [Rubrobacter sp.]|nr:methyltransferase domain-containing protein [Rubrobacter sp.]